MGIERLGSGPLTSTTPPRPTRLWARLLTAALPLYVTVTIDRLGMIVVIAMLGNHATSTLAAFVFATVVFIPTSISTMSALRGTVPTLTPALRNPKHATLIVRDIRWLSLSLGMVGSVPLLCLPLLAQPLGISSEIAKALGYLPWFMAFALVALALKLGVIQALIAYERSKDVLWPGIADISVTVSLAVFLVPIYGINGGGAAFMTGSIVGAASSFWYLRRITGGTGWARPRPRHMWTLARIGFPLAGGSLVHMGALAILTLAATRIGSTEAAAHGIMFEFMPLITILASSIGQVSIPIMSRQLADSPANCIRNTIARTAFVITAAMSIAVGALVLGGPYVVPLFATQTEPVELVLRTLPVLAIAIMLQGLLWIPNAGLIALKRTPVTFGNMLVCYGLLAIVAIPIADQFGLIGLWLGLMAANVALIIGQMTALWKFTRP